MLLLRDAFTALVAGEVGHLARATTVVNCLCYVGFLTSTFKRTPSCIRPLGDHDERRRNDNPGGHRRWGARRADALHLLAMGAIDSVTVDIRPRLEIEHTVRAGILEADSVKLLVESGVSDRVLREGHAHGGIDLRFAGATTALTSPGSSVSRHGCTRRRTSSSTSPTPAHAMVATCASALPT